MRIILKRLGRWLDKTWRTHRPVLLPAFYRAYRGLKQRAVPIPIGTQPLIVFDLRNNRVDGPQGRRFYNLATMWIKAGYHPVFIDRQRFLANPRANFKARVFKHHFSLINDLSDLSPYIKQSVVLTDQSVAAHPFRQQALAIMEISLAVGPPQQGDEHAWPFPMFPIIYDEHLDDSIDSARANDRLWTFFFGGRSSGHSYDKGWVSSIYNKVPRNRYLALVEHALEQEHIPLTQPKGSDNWQAPPQPNALFIRNEQCKIPLTQWLPTIASARFFLACPGVRYPMSHNAVEALAVGTVPILEYPEDFFPTLEDGKNCLTFSGEQGLLTTIQRAAHMTHDEWLSLSTGAQAYYDSYLSPKAATQGFLSAAKEGKTVLRLVPYLKEGGGLV